MSANEKTHVYVDVELAEKIKGLEKGAAINAVIEEYFDESKDDMKNQVESLDHHVTEYRGLMAKASRLFDEASDEVLEKSYKVWESFDEKMPYLEEKIEGIVKKLAPITKELDEIEKRINAIPSHYRLKDTVELIERLAESNPKTIDLLEFLVNHYKEEPKK